MAKIIKFPRIPIPKPVKPMKKERKVSRSSVKAKLKKGEEE